MQVLVTRPSQKAQSLIQALKPMVDKVYHQQVIEIKDGPDLNSVPQYLNQQSPSIIIFVSAHAVEYFIKALNTPTVLAASNCQLIAVGQATKKALTDWCNNDVLTPTLETSEGLLQLEQLQSEQVNHRQVAIVRGVGGREMLATTLSARGASINYWQVYQRHPITEGAQLWFSQWQHWKIDTIVITSVAIFDAISHNMSQTAQTWLRSRRFVVASSRIAAHLTSKGVEANNIFDAKGANDLAILAQIEQLPNQ